MHEVRKFSSNFVYPTSDCPTKLHNPPSPASIIWWLSSQAHHGLVLSTEGNKPLCIGVGPSKSDDHENQQIGYPPQIWVILYTACVHAIAVMVFVR